jgi:hypothetical protein
LSNTLVNREKQSLDKGYRKVQEIKIGP